MHEPLITVVGNVGAPPRLRVLASGAVVTDFRVASTPRKHDKGSDTWTDGARYEATAEDPGGRWSYSFQMR